MLLRERERELKMSNNTYTVPESYPMNGRDGINSYTKNSYFQLAQLVKSLIVVQEIWGLIPPTPKTDWCLGLIIKSHHQEWTP